MSCHEQNLCTIDSLSMLVHSCSGLWSIFRKLARSPGSDDQSDRSQPRSVRRRKHQSPLRTTENHRSKSYIELLSFISSHYIFNITNEQQYTVKWSRYRSPLPATSQVRGNVLTLQNLRVEDSDRYLCKVESQYGSSSDYIDLNVLRKW